MNNQEALNTLNDIRNMMEKSTRFVSFSGLSSIVIGIYACIAAIIAYSILGNTTPVPRLDVDTPAKLQLLIVFASLLIIVCIVTVILMCRHKAHQNNQSLLFDFNTKRLLWNFFLPLVVGGILCIIDLAKPLWPYFFDHADILWRRSDQCVELYVFQYPLSGLCGNRSRPGR